MLEYAELDDGTLDYFRTFTPVRLRHRGIGHRLVRFALDDALDRGVRVRPSCPFVASVLKNDAKYAELLS